MGKRRSQRRALYRSSATGDGTKPKMSNNTLEQYHLTVDDAKVLLSGKAIGDKIGSGRVKIIHSPVRGSFNIGDVLVADITDPDWEPIMKKASAVITNRGGRTCHAAIVAREIGVPQS
jgi:pyruvate, water dikinase